MTVSHAHIYYPSTIDAAGALAAQTSAGYDLRKVQSWSTTDAPPNTASAYVAGFVKVVMQGGPDEARMTWPKAEFEAAKAVSLAFAGG